jgi:dihydrofolate reductase
VIDIVPSGVNDFEFSSANGPSVIVGSSDAVEETNWIAKLKAQVGKDLVIYGHGLLGQTLLKHHLLDELKLWIHPCFVGRGKLLFSEGEKTNLKLIAQKLWQQG